MAFTRRPPGLLRGQGVDHGLPFVQRLWREHLAQRRQAGLMAQQLTQGDGLFAGGGEFRPVLRHRRVQLELAFGHQLQRGHCGKGLGAGEQVGNGVAVPGLGAVFVGSTGPEVDHGFTADLNAQRRAALLGIFKEGREGFTHGLEFKLVMTLNLHP